MFGPIDNVVFDLDGTLVDTMPSVIEGLGLAIQTATGAPVDAQALVASFGPAPLALLEKWVPAAQVPSALQCWLDYEKALSPDRYLAFDGVPQMLSELAQAGKKLAIFTGRDRLGAIRILKAHDWLGTYFAQDNLLCGDDKFTPKPNPEALLELLVRRGWDASRTLMVGDHEHDMSAGRGAGVKTAAAVWSTRSMAGTNRARFREAWQKWDAVNCDVRLDSPLSLTKWLAPS